TAARFTKARLHAALGWTECHENGKADVDSIPVKRLQRVGNETCRHAGTDTWFQTVPGVEVSRVATLKFRDGEDIVRVDCEVVARLAGQLETSKPRVALVKREIGLNQEGVRRIVPWRLIAAPSDRARPDAALTKDAMVRRRRGHAVDVDSR